jgi:hypothetical protein
MAKPRPPVIISNGTMRERMKKRFDNHSNEYKDETDIIYGLGTDNGFLTLVTLDDGSQFVYWRATEDEPKFTCLESEKKGKREFTKRKVVAEQEINFKGKWFD